MSVCEVGVIPRATTIVMPSMSASIGYIEMRTTEIVVIAMRIAGIDTEVPVATLPPQWAIEITCSAESLILPVEKDISQIRITMNPIVRKNIVICIYAQKIIEIHLVCSLILLLVKIKLIRHLICKEQSLLAGLFVTHSICRCDE
jgi:hypothetical protein